MPWRDGWYLSPENRSIGLLGASRGLSHISRINPMFNALSGALGGGARMAAAAGRKTAAGRKPSAASAVARKAVASASAKRKASQGSVRKPSR